MRWIKESDKPNGLKLKLYFVDGSIFTMNHDTEQSIQDILSNLSKNGFNMMTKLGLAPSDKIFGVINWNHVMRVERV